MQIVNLNNKISKKRKPLSKFTSYFIVVFALMVVNPFFDTVSFTYLSTLLSFLIILTIYKGIKLFEKKILLILLSVYLLIIFQSLLFRNISYAAIYNPILIFYIPFLIYRLIGASFFKYLVHVLYVIAIYTTALWLMQSFIPAVDDLMQNAIQWVFSIGWTSTPRSLLFYTAAWSNLIFNQNFGVYRNSGLFHEPGGYAVFLILGIVIKTLRHGKLFDRKNLVFIFCLLTTLSTAGFFSLFIVIFAFFMKLKSAAPIKIAGLIVFTYISYNTFQGQDFLKEKVISHYETESSAAASPYLGKTTEQSGRFFAFYMGIVRFIQNPFFGQGIISATTAKGTGELHMGSSTGYGFMDIFATYGIFFGSFYIINFYKGMKKLRIRSTKSNVFLLLLFLSLMFALSTQALIKTTVLVTIFIFGVYSDFSKTDKNEKKTIQKYGS